MGVRHLESYLEKKSQGACYKVHIGTLVERYKLDSGLEPVIVIDGMSCLRPLYLFKNLSWLNGGQLKEFHAVVKQLISNFTNLGCKLVVYFDGPVQEIKLPTWKKRRIQSANDLTNILSKLPIRTSEELENSVTSILPNGLGWIFLQEISQNKNCKIIKALSECDEEIASYAYKHNCFAILAQDTDYVIYKAAKYYLSAKHLNVDDMTTLCYDRIIFCRELSISLDQLPLMASLLGNDIVDFDEVKNFLYRLKRKYRENDFIKAVSKYISYESQRNLVDIAVQVFGNVDKLNLLQKSISSYDLNKVPSKSNLIKGLNTSDENWRNAEKLIINHFLTSPYTAPLYDIAILNRFHSSTCLEDYGFRDNFPPIGMILKELRRSMYGILLQEKPLKANETCHTVKECVMTGFSSLDEDVFVQPKYLEKVSHPGLKALWTSNGKDIVDTKWKMLAEIFKVEVTAIKHLPPWLLIPTLSTRYFIDQYSGIAESELDVMLATNVCVKNYSAENLATLPSGPLEYRPIWLYSTVSRIYMNVNNLFFYIWDIIPIKYTVLYQFTDGKLFQEKYRRNNENPSVEALCEHQVENLELFNQMKSVVMS